MSELKPCPFCGGEVELKVTRNTLRAQVFCENCNVRMKRLFINEDRIEQVLVELMTDAWNRRANDE